MDVGIDIRALKQLGHKIATRLENFPRRLQGQFGQMHAAGLIYDAIAAHVGRHVGKHEIHGPALKGLPEFIEHGILAEIPLNEGHTG